MMDLTPVFQVSELNETVRDVLELQFANVTVEGEISNLARPASGHLYFSLKDARASVSCALFKGNRYKVKIPWSEISNGLQIRVQARVSLYAPRGQYQLIVSAIEPAGLGNLEREYRERLERLSKEGLFAPELKKAIPKYPRAIGLITSKSGAAVHDAITTLKRRNPALPIVLYPTLVQGKTAAENIRAQLAAANRRQDCDLLLMIRGGGSLEDLWAFNDEQLARDIVASRLPIISGVGHEIDTTLVDFASDLRAPTPTAAAELATLPLAEITATFAAQTAASEQRFHAFLQHQKQALDGLRYRLLACSPQHQLERRMQRLDELQERLTRAAATSAEARRVQLSHFAQQLSPVLLQLRLASERKNLRRLNNGLAHNSAQLLNARKARFSSICQSLAHLNPLGVLGRGYALATDSHGKVIKQLADTAAHEPIQVRISDGTIHCTVDALKPL